MQADGVHPVEAAQPLLLATVWPRLEPSAQALGAGTCPGPKPADALLPGSARNRVRQQRDHVHEKVGVVVRGCAGDRVFPAPTRGNPPPRFPGNGRCRRVGADGRLTHEALRRGDKRRSHDQREHGHRVDAVGGRIGAEMYASAACVDRLGPQTAAVTRAHSRPPRRKFQSPPNASLSFRLQSRGRESADEAQTP